MTYIKRTKECSAREKKRENQRAAKARKRESGDPPPLTRELPNLRRIVIVIDYDFGPHVEVFSMWKTKRRDCYKLCRKDGTVINPKIGWAKTLETIRKGFLRVGSADWN